MSSWGGRAVMELRRPWQVRIDAGGVDCGRCGHPVVSGQAWALGHLVDRALGGTVADGLHPEHRRCSDQSGGQLAARLGVGAHARRRTTSQPSLPVVERRKW